MALTAAEYLAFVEGKHALAILTDMTHYAEALSEVSSSKGEIPPKGFPGYLHSDLATLFERAGTICGLPGTLTQLSILTLPADDIGHPIPDFTGYLTEGRIVLSRDLDRRSVRRVRALQDVLLPELAGETHGMETPLEELEQEDALAMRGRRMMA